MKTHTPASLLHCIAPLALLLAAAGSAAAAKASLLPRVAPFELRDQDNALHQLAFPATNVTVLVVADKKGSEQVEGWIAPLKRRYQGRVAIEGIANIGKVPGPLRSLVRDQFKRKRDYPIMLDWDGSVAGSLPCEKERANVFVLSREGQVTARFAGAATEGSLKRLFLTIDQARPQTSP